jgi:hypothetical protein
MKRIRWDYEKNVWLKSHRNITFDEILVLIEQGHILDVVMHPSSYRNQKLILINVDGYVYCVPFEETEKEVWLKTIFPSGKFTKMYLGGE